MCVLISYIYHSDYFISLGRFHFWQSQKRYFIFLLFTRKSNFLAENWFPLNTLPFFEGSSSIKPTTLKELLFSKAIDNCLPA